MINHLPILQVALPLFAAPIVFVLPNARLAWSAAMGISIACLIIAAALLAQTLDGSVLSYEIGGWVAPLGIEYRIDVLSALIIGIICFVNLICLAAAETTEPDLVSAHQRPWFYCAWILCFTGLLGIAATGDLFNVFVFLEISSLSTYILVSFGRRRQALKAAFRYLVLGTIGATFFLIGVGLVYMLTGTLNMVDMAERLGGVDDRLTLYIAFAFLFIGLGIKMALFPLHWWMPDAYAEAPSSVSAMLSGTATKVSVYVLLRVLFTVFGIDVSIGTLGLDTMIVPLALAGIIAGSAVACWQDDAKRLLAWSSVGQLGYMALGIGLANASGIAASVAHIGAHALMKSALFLAIAGFIYRTGSPLIRDWEGAGRQMPWTFGGFIVAALSLLGIPLTVGFISKWYLVLATVDQGWWWATLFIIVSSLLAVIYIWRIVESLWFKPRPEGAATLQEAPLALIIPIWALSAANLYFGIDARLINTASTTAAALLTGSAP